MKQVKTSELQGPALDWAVAKAEGRTIKRYGVRLYYVKGDYEFRDAIGASFSPSTNWAQGGSIIERLKGLSFKQWLEANREGQCQVEIHNHDGDWIAFGPTTLIAAMRCFVASKLGDVVSIPEELL